MKKQLFIIFFIFFIVFFSIQCKQQEKNYNQTDIKTFNSEYIATGKYFGQTPPDDSAVVFAPGIISTENT